MIVKPYKIEDETGYDGLVPLDPRDESTWKNSPAPVDVSDLQRELTKIGGRVPVGYGEISGQPILRIVWGQSETMFLGGAERLRFDDQAIPAIIRQKHFIVTDDCFERCIAWVNGCEQKKRDAFMRCDWHGATRLYRIHTYLRQKETTLNWKLLEGDRSYEDLARLVPVGWKYLADIPDVVEIGMQAFFVVQWIPPSLLGSERDWSDSRYGWELSLETGRREYQDITGPYPKHGAYENVVHFVAEKTRLRVSVDEIDYYRYITPTRTNTIEPIIEAINNRENLESTHDLKKASVARFKRHKEWQEKKNKDFSVTLKTMIRDAMPVGKGNPVSFLNSKVKSEVIL